MIKLTTLATARQTGVLFVNVTVEDIERGECRHRHLCAISQALRRMYGDGWQTGGRSIYHICENESDSTVWTLPRSAMQFILRFDMRIMPWPIEFAAQLNPNPPKYTTG